MKMYPTRAGIVPLVCLLALLACWPVAAVQAQARAWLDRERIALDETATLNVETTEAGVAAPDWSALESDFRLSGHTSSRQVEIVNGRSQARVLFAVALSPRRTGALVIPPLRVGSASTGPLTLTVGAADATPARAGDPAFIESELDADHAYVQQAIGYVLRLYYATPLISGELEQPAPDGAALQRIGNDVQYNRDIGGRRYTVVERRFLLVPERSGTLAIPGARFTGRGTGNFFDDLFRDGSRLLRADGAPRFLEVRPVPDGAPQPWLPLRGLQLKYLSTSQQARAGEAVEIVVEARADGASGSQLPALELTVDGGAQVFSEPPEVEEGFDQGRPVVRVTRQFSIVPARAGTLTVRGPRQAWWDVGADAARIAELPDLMVDVAPGQGAAAAAPDAGVRNVPPGIRVPGVQEPIGFWPLATVVFALLWLLTLGWALQRRPHASGGAHADVPDAVATGASTDPRMRMRALRDALQAGDLHAIADALCALATPPAEGLDALARRLADPQQRDAIDQLQRARWAGGDAAAARAAVRSAFREGPRWHDADAHEEQPVLPPLYPR
ncbi:protein BatD [Luteimonas yindakuii]|uniref:BatD family protein n=1 Tax=Luteimonas yindakuii TaxID=2565782 RepID=UPI0011078B46|nr:BatD family protein [Luteimonas yindakuii]QCU72425.1 protein BatD [Luteimonas yindakuii]